MVCFRLDMTRISFTVRVAFRAAKVTTPWPFAQSYQTFEACQDHVHAAPAEPPQSTAPSVTEPGQRLKVAVWVQTISFPARQQTRTTTLSVTAPDAPAGLIAITP